MNYTEISDQVVNGEVNALKAYIELKQASAQLEAALKIVYPLAIDEAGKYSEKTFKAFGATIEKRNGPSQWDYSGVLAYQQAQERLKYIQKIAQAGGGFDAQTTEQIEKAVKIEGKTTIAISLSK